MFKKFLGVDGSQNASSSVSGVSNTKKSKRRRSARLAKEETAKETSLEDVVEHSDTEATSLETDDLSLSIEPPAIVQERELADGDVAITIGRNCPTVVQEVRKVRINEQRIAYVPDVAVSSESRSQDFSVAVISQDDLHICQRSLYQSFPYPTLEQCMGKELVVSLSPDSSLEGTLLSCDNGKLSLLCGSQVKTLKYDDSNYFSYQLKHPPENLSEDCFRLTGSSYLQLEFMQNSTGKEDAGQIELESEESRCCLLELCYKCPPSLITWNARYNAILNNREDFLWFSGCVNVTNNSNRTFKDALVFYVQKEERVQDYPLRRSSSANSALFTKFMQSGSVKQQNSSAPRQNVKGKKTRTRYNNKLRRKKITQEGTKFALSDRSVTLPSKESVNIELFNVKIPVVCWNLYKGSSLRFDGTLQTQESYGKYESGSVHPVVLFSNSEDLGLGMLLPGGPVTVYRKEPDGFGVEIVNDDAYLPTSEPERNMSLSLGVLDNLQTSRRQVSFHLDNRQKIMKEEFEIKITNTSLRSEYTEVVVEEYLYRWQDATVEHPDIIRTEDSNVVRFRLIVGPDETKTLRYQVVYKNF